MSTHTDLHTWATRLNADNLHPDPDHHADFGHHPHQDGPLMRLHFAFTTGTDETARHALAQIVVDAANQALKEAFSSALDDDQPST